MRHQPPVALTGAHHQRKGMSELPRHVWHHVERLCKTIWPKR